MHTIDSIHYVNALAPVADAFAGTANSDIINVKNCSGIEFLVITGVGATGTSTFTVDACDDTSASNTTAVAFWYKEITSDPGDTTWTVATSAGWTRTAGSSAMFRVWVPSDLIGATGYNYARLTATEVTDSAVLGGILAILHEPKFMPETTTVIT